MSKIYGLFALPALLLGTEISRAQSFEISGTVRSREENFPLSGASVVVKGTSRGVITDDKGQFTLTISSSDTLRVSELGYQPRDTTISGPASGLVIPLESATSALNEVVVTALNISKEKKSLGYSVQELKTKDISEAREPNLVNALSGKVAGVNVTNSQGDMGSSRIIIRGETSISGNNQPLFVIDGVPVDNTQFLGGTGGDRDPEASRDFSNAIADINPSDIASVSVLKGPNAAALYGSRAAAGVILIQTKSGKGEKGLGVTLNSNTTLSNLLVLPSYQNVFGQGSSGKFSYVDGAGGGVNDAVDESWGPPMDGRLIPQFFSGGKAVPFVPHPDNVKDFFRTGYKLDNEIAFAGSGDKYNFRFSYNNMSQHGVIPNTAQERNSFLVNAGYQITPKLSLDVMANYIRRDAPNLPGGSGLRETSTMLQFTWFGRQVDMDKLYQLYKEGSLINWNNLYYSNRYFIAYNNTVAQQRNRLIGNVNLKYQITKDLTASFLTGNDYYADRRKMKVAFDTKGAPYGSYGEDTYIVNENNTEGRLDYNRQLSDDFSLDILGGGNIRTNTTENNDQRAPQLAVAGVYTLNNSRVPLVSNNYYTKLKTYSLFSSAQIGFRHYAYLNLTARNDWSSSLPVENLSYFYPSVNGSFILSEALHMTSDRVNFIKLRGGWSKVGKATSAYQLINTYGFTTPFDTDPQLHAGSIDLNPDLKPEQTTSVEAGAEAGFFHDRLHLDLSFYNMNSFNQILAVDVSPATGYEQKLINGGKINNKGLEVELDVTPVQTGDFTWNIMTNYSANRSKVVSLDKAGRLNSYVLGSDGTVQVLAAIDQPYGTLFGTAFERNDNGEIMVDQSGRPVVDPDKKYLGKFTPDWLGSINNSFSWHGFQLSFLVDARVGGSIYSSTNSTGTYTGVLASTLPGRDAAHGGLRYYYPGDDDNHAAVPLPEGGTAPGGATVHDDGMIFKGVHDDGKQNDVIISAQDYYKSLTNVDEAFIYNASFVKLREVRLGYELPAAFIHSLGLQSAAVSLVGRNLWIISKHVPNIDPETAFNTGNGQGLEDLALPTVRSLGVNINVKF
ncbi:SusC/RagA family TonB-linked outer membrane protein [Compostibacter hankyongensis]|uniref:SusC/RagA family TonB-linked outer membrane protein n=1 Tax=Compostibacter hankyongensis TaxID=1007089 RepID=A0ABP8GB68_9BACT